MRIGIRREDKSRWERRAPLSPEAILELRSLSGAGFVIQPSTIRIFPDTAYLAAGAEVSEDLRECDILFAVKEIPLEMIYRGKVLLFFSHTIKGQAHNMGLLRRMVEQESTLIDYERIVDDTNRRLVFFGRHAGYAGMLDGLAALTGRLAMEGLESPLDAVRNAWQYDSLDAARHELRAIGKKIREEGLGRELGPVVIGFTGFGNVSKGAQSILGELPVEPLDPEKLATLHEGPWSDRVIYSVELAQKDMFRRRDGGVWNEERYWSTPAEYESNMDRVLPHLLLLVNGILWTANYPRLVSRDLLASLYAEAGGKPRLRTIADISIDIEGSIECSAKATHSDDPCYTYNPEMRVIRDGIHRTGVVIMAVDNLPCELPRESTETFSAALAPLVPYLCRADFSKPFAELDLPAPLRRAVILHHGKFTPDYTYMSRFIDGAGA